MCWACSMRRCSSEMFDKTCYCCRDSHGFRFLSIKIGALMFSITPKKSASAGDKIIGFIITLIVLPFVLLGWLIKTVINAITNNF